ncbi:MAG: ATP-binding protein [Methanomassiliicoccaceae archaeon]|nr:ATP-binding protein [Methanomassiliicoccaceae archaeon]
MEPLIGREKELDWLNGLFSKRGPETCAVYGRRRVGKTALLTQFCADKEAFFFTASQGSTEEDTLRNFTEAMGLFAGHDVGGAKTFSGALRKFGDLIGERKTVMVIDEFPYLTRSLPGSASDLQAFIDRGMKSTNLFLIVCGSSISAMRSEIDDKEKPLMGRFMNRTELKPLPFSECRKFHTGLSDTENMAFYMVLGGVPMYHRMTEGRTFEEAVTDGFLSGFPFLSEEALSIIYRELPRSDDILKILDAIAGGAVVQKEIVEKTGIAQSLCSIHLSSMEFLGIIGKDTPMANSPKRPVYRIHDSLLSFYFSLIRKRPAFAGGADPKVAFERLEQMIDSHLGHEFEKVCREYLASKIPCVEIGRWWGRIGDEDTDIDIVAIATDGKMDCTVFAECKYSKWAVERSVLEKLKYRSQYAKGTMNCRYVLFSRSGFDKDLQERAEAERTTLITLEQMYDGGIEWRIF